MNLLPLDISAAEIAAFSLTFAISIAAIILTWRQASLQEVSVENSKRQGYFDKRVNLLLQVVEDLQFFERHAPGIWALDLMSAANATKKLNDYTATFSRIRDTISLVELLDSRTGKSEAGRAVESARRAEWYIRLGDGAIDDAGCRARLKNAMRMSIAAIRTKTVEMLTN